MAFGPKLNQCFEERLFPSQVSPLFGRLVVDLRAARNAVRVWWDFRNLTLSSQIARGLRKVHVELETTE